MVLAWGIGIEWTTPEKIRGRTWNLGRLLNEMEKKYVKDGGMDGGLLFDLGLLLMPVDAGGKSQLLRVLSHMDGISKDTIVKAIMSRSNQSPISHDSIFK